MKNYQRFLPFFLALAVLLSGCAYVPQEANLAPKCEIPKENIGRGTQIGLTVIDERTEKAIGHRGNVYGAAAEINTKQDVAEVFYTQIAEGLKCKGFVPVESKQVTERLLKVEIRLLEYSTSTGFWTGGLHTKAAMKAYARNNTKTHENLYRAENEERTMVVPGEEHNEKLINAIIEKIITEFFQDKDMLAFLASN